ncbi:MAG: hypothetical protein U1F57_03445 [bacterium]
MEIVLRIIGGIWVLLTFADVLSILRRILYQGASIHLGLSNLLDILLLAGGVGLLMLREWGRWLILAGCIALLVLKAGAPLFHLHFPPWIVKLLVFYGIFIVLLSLPQARAATRK